MMRTAARVSSPKAACPPPNVRTQPLPRAHLGPGRLHEDRRKRTLPITGALLQAWAHLTDWGG
jgi:hypothetical protein